MSARQRLEPRRWGLVVTARYSEPGRIEIKLYITVGIDRATLRVGEVFARPGGEAGKFSLLERTLDDIAPIISHLLQRGAAPDEVAKSLGREGGEAAFTFDLPAAPGGVTTAVRSVTMKVSSPVAALAAACIAVQHELDALPEDLRAELQQLTPVPVVSRAQASDGDGGGGETLARFQIADVQACAAEIEALMLRLVARHGVHCAVTGLMLAEIEAWMRNELTMATVEALQDVARVAHARGLAGECVGRG